MTTEDDFQSILDSNPEDWHTRLVFADWLQDRDDKRADGYRALAINRKTPIKKDYYYLSDECPYWYKFSIRLDSYGLPPHWYGRLVFKGKDTFCCPLWSMNCKATRRQLEDAAAVAFTLLTLEEQRELLNPPVSHLIEAVQWGKVSV